jgi:hypothetical protein
MHQRASTEMTQEKPLARDELCPVGRLLDPSGGACHLRSASRVRDKVTPGQPVVGADSWGSRPLIPGYCRPL